MNNFIFSELPYDLIKNILLYDEHFIIRKGVITSIISKTDYRYKLLHFFIPKLRIKENLHKKIKYTYHFPNLYNYEGRQAHNSDLIDIIINECNNNIKYSIWIGRQYPKSFICNKKQNYYIEKPSDFNWIYTQYEYIRT